jgi:hypothetical protein
MAPMGSGFNARQGVAEMNNDFVRCSEWLGTRITFRMHQALELMAVSLSYSEDLGCIPWEFSVPVAELRSAGLSDNDFRWLIRKGLVEHSIELTEVGEKARSFRPSEGCTFSDRSAFVLTEKGNAFVSAGEVATLFQSNDCNGHAMVDGHDAPVVPKVGSAVAVTLPTWDRDRQELRWGGDVVKQFKVPSPNQETILAAFEEEHWPPRIDDPLPPQLDQEPKRRLHDTINTLNRNQKCPLIRFLGDGSGQGVRWEPVGRESVRNGKLSRAAAAPNGRPVEPKDA